MLTYAYIKTNSMYGEIIKLILIPEVNWRDHNHSALILMYG